MHITISFDPITILGIAVLAFAASFVGNIIAGVIVGIFTPSLDGQKVYTLAGLAMMAGKMIPLKFIVALIGSAVAISMNATQGSATLWAMGISAGLGFLVSLLAGLGSRS